MTCIVGIVEAGNLLLAGDSAGVSLQEKEWHSFTNAKVFQRGPYVIGFTTSFRLGQILRFETELPEPGDQDLDCFMATTFVAAVRQSLKTQDFTRGLGEQGSVLVGIRGQLFAIGADFQVLTTATPYMAVGSGRHLAYGALCALEGSGLSLRKKAEMALRAAERFNPTVREPFVYVEVGTGPLGASPRPFHQEKASVSSALPAA